MGVHMHACREAVGSIWFGLLPDLVLVLVF